MLDESVLIARGWIGIALEAHARRRAGARLWTFDLAELRHDFLRLAAAAGVAFLRPVLYMGRHSDASLDWLENRCSLAEVRQRGRWRAASTAARYAKKALVQEFLLRMRAADRVYCRRVAPELPPKLLRAFRCA